MEEKGVYPSHALTGIPGALRVGGRGHSKLWEVRDVMKMDGTQDMALRDGGTGGASAPRRTRQWIVALALAGASLLSGAVLAAAVEEKADQLLRGMTDFLAKQQAFSAKVDNSIEVVLVSGQKLQFDAASALAVQRPNHLHVTRGGDLIDQALYFDGRAVTLFSNLDGQGHYASLPAAGGLEGALDVAREKLNLEAPAADLLYGNAYDILMEDVMTGMYVGPATIGGVRCHHLAYRGSQTDWQIWIEDGDKPLPRKMVITTKWLTGAPQFTMHTSDWNLAPKFGADAFTFVAPAGAKEVPAATVAAQMGVKP
jgi:hypothetical protein